jgi:hypothetical protein
MRDLTLFSTVAELGALRRAREPARVLVIEERKDRIATINRVAVDLAQDGFDAIFADALVGVGNGLSAFGERFFAKREDGVFEGHLGGIHTGSAARTPDAQ